MMENQENLEGQPNYATFLPDNSQYDLFGDYSFGLDMIDFGLPEDNFETDTLDFLFLEPGATLRNESETFEARAELLTTASSYSAIPSLPPQAATENSQNEYATTASQSFPPEDQEILSSDQNIKNRKESWQNNVIVFSAKGKRTVTPRRRRPYSPSRKEKVALNRLIGACVQCKLRKGPCDFGIPCNHCAKRAGSVTLGREICVRQSLAATRFDHVDLFRAKFHEENLESEGLRNKTGPRRTVYIGFPAYCEPDSAETFIQVPIIDMKNYSDECDLLVYSYYKSEVVRDRCHQSVMVWDSVPTLDQLIQLCRVSRRNNPSCPTPNTRNPFWGLQQAVRRFAEEYCSITEEMPLKGLLYKLLRMQDLSSIYRSGLRVKESLASRDTVVLSKESLIQVRAIISKEIIQLEFAILSQIDKLIYNSINFGKEKPLAFWVCLWTLMLSYKSHTIYSKAGAENSTLTFNIREVGEVYELSRHIYNTLTSIYATIYRTTSPFTFDWRQNDVAEMLGHNQQLIRLFSNIKTEMFWFQAEKELLFAEDALFKKLVLENENKLLAAHLRLAKRQGFL